MPSSKGSSQPRDGSYVSCMAGRFLSAELLGKPFPGMPLYVSLLVFILLKLVQIAIFSVLNDHCVCVEHWWIPEGNALGPAPSLYCITSYSCFVDLTFSLLSVFSPYVPHSWLYCESFEVETKPTVHAFQTLDPFYSEGGSYASIGIT